MLSWEQKDSTETPNPSQTKNSSAEISMLHNVLYFNCVVIWRLEENVKVSQRWYD